MCALHNLMGIVDIEYMGSQWDSTRSLTVFSSLCYYIYHLPSPYFMLSAGYGVPNLATVEPHFLSLILPAVIISSRPTYAANILECIHTYMYLYL